MEDATGLLTAADPAPVEVVNADGRSPVLLTCEHAGRTIPARLGDLGLAEADLARHIGWDIGADGLSRALAAALDARLVLQRFSRLVIDCNRPWGAPDLVPEVSDGTRVPGNLGLGEAERRRRHDEIHAALHGEIAAQIARRRPGALVAVHSFNPTLGTEVRPMQVGLLYNRDNRLARALGAALAPRIGDDLVALNRPYSVDDYSDETIPRHGEATGIPHVLLEVRNDCLGTDAEQRRWAALVAEALGEALARIG